MWNPWKFATIGLSAMVATALVTGLVISSWSGRDADRPAISSIAPRGGFPMQTSIADCNQIAAAQVGGHDKTGEVVKDTTVGAGRGSLYGLNENKKHDEAYRAAYARCMASRGYRS